MFAGAVGVFYTAVDDVRRCEFAEIATGTAASTDILFLRDWQAGHRLLCEPLTSSLSD